MELQEIGLDACRDILTLVEKLTKAEQENKETSGIKLNSSAIYHKEIS